jgi:hypothetical protein
MTRMKNRTLEKAIIAILLGSLTSVSIIANTEEWTGIGNDYHWSTNGNWKGAFGIDQNDDLIFPNVTCIFNNLNCTDSFRRAPNVNDFPAFTSFRSIMFLGRGYRISGNPISLTSGFIATNISDPVFSPNISISQTQTWSVSSGSSLTINGFVNMNGNAIRFDGNGGTVVLNGLITGDGSFTKDGSGKLVVNDGADMRSTYLNAGTLELNGTLGPINIQGGNLTGAGTLDGVFLASEGMISPGIEVGDIATLTNIGFVRLFPNSTFAVDIESTKIGGICDRLRVLNGDLVLDGAALEVSFETPPPAGRSFVIAQQTNQGAITGQFEQGTALVKNNQLFFITYFPDRVVLTAQGPVGP